MANQKFSYKYSLAIVGAVILTWILHEFGHWLASEWYGYDTAMKMNGTYPVGAKKWTASHSTVISAIGPLVTFTQGLIVFLILRSSKFNKYLYPLLFTAFYMRLLAGLMNFINLNDEGRISEYLGIGVFTLPIIVSGMLFYMVYSTSKNNKLNWRFHLKTTLTIMLFSSILILIDQFIGIRIL